jgi:hypothetical protein
MPNRNYRKGRAYEYEIKKRYEKLGYTVFRTAGSHSPADLIAVKNIMSRLEVLLIQCKTTKKSIDYRPRPFEREGRIFNKWARSLGCLGRFFVKGRYSEISYDSEVGDGYAVFH